MCTIAMIGARRSTGPGRAPETRCLRLRADPARTTKNVGYIQKSLKLSAALCRAPSGRYRKNAASPINVIRMIAWIPLLGRHGVVNTVLQRLGVIDAPLEWLLYSEFAVVVGYIHLYTLFMIVPIFNAMMRVDRTLLEAAGDGGATEWQTLWHVIVPLCKPGI